MSFMEMRGFAGVIAILIILVVNIVVILTLSYNTIISANNTIVQI